MNKKVVFGLLLGFLSMSQFIIGRTRTTFTIQKPFPMPDPSIQESVCFNQMCFLSCHNAYASEQYGYIYANQYWTIAAQLERGVRSFELDLEKRSWTHQYPFWGPAGSTISLCHSSCAINALIQPNPAALVDKTQGPNSLVSILELYVDFLNQFPDQIISITFESRVNLDFGATYQDLDSQFDAAGISAMTLKPSDWDPVANEGWPTIAWLLANNKRFICFSDQSSAEVGYPTSMPYASSYYTFYQWYNFAQNQSGYAKDLTTALQERSASQAYNMNTKYFMELDWYADGGKILGGFASDVINAIGQMIHKETPFGGDYAVLNGPQLQNFITTAYNQGLTTQVNNVNKIIGKNRYPNLIKVDYFHEGNVGTQDYYPLALVNLINKISYAADPATRTQMFAPLLPS